MKFFNAYKEKYSEGIVWLIDEAIDRIATDCADVLNFSYNTTTENPLLFIPMDGSPATEERITDALVNEHIATLKTATPHKGEPEFISHQIPDEAFLMVLMDDPDVINYINTLASVGVKVDELKNAIKNDYIETLVYAPNGELSKEGAFSAGPTEGMKWAFNNADNPSAYDPAWYLHTLLWDKTRPSNYHYAYETAGLRQGTLKKVEQFWFTKEDSHNPDLGL